MSLAWLPDFAERWLAPNALYKPRRGEDLDHYFARVRPKLVARPELLAQPFADREDDKRQPERRSALPLHWLYALAAEELTKREAAEQADWEERGANGDMSPEPEAIGCHAASALAGQTGNENLGFYEAHFLDWVSLAPDVDLVVSNPAGDPRWEEVSFFVRETRRLLALAVGDDTFMAPASWVKALLDAGADANAKPVGTAGALFRVLWRQHAPTLRAGRWGDAGTVAKLLLSHGADPWAEPELDRQDSVTAGRVWLIANQLRGERKSLAPMSIINSMPENVTPGVREAILDWVRADLDGAIDQSGDARESALRELRSGDIVDVEVAPEKRRAPRRPPRRL